VSFQYFFPSELKDAIERITKQQKSYKRWNCVVPVMNSIYTTGDGDDEEGEEEGEEDEEAAEDPVAEPVDLSSPRKSKRYK
jgi:hypothetical protein